MQYAHDVMAGKIPVCRYVRQAVERHLRDLKDGHKRGLHFDDASARHAIDFFGFLHHSKGEWAGRTIELQPWQQFIVWVVFGWKRADGTRRFRTVYEEVARKNGKSTKLAGIGNYLFVADDEPGAEVYSAATKRDQAIIVHSEAVRMVKASSGLSSRVKVYKNNLSVEATNSKFEPLGADDDTLDGLNVHGAIIDEVHAHKSRGVFDVLDTATGSRRQPLIWTITTAGVDRNSICWELRDYTTKVLDGTLQDDSWFGIIYCLEFEHRDKKLNDDWTDESTWIKANPNLGVSVKLDDLRRGALRASTVATAANNFLRKRLNVWTNQDTKWIDMDKWRLCDAGAPDDLVGRECIGAVDLSVRRDLTAFARVYPLGDNEYGCLWDFWLPAEGIDEKARVDRAPYREWAKAGYLTLIDGDTIDYDVVRDRILEVRAGLREVTFDAANATHLITQMQREGVAVTEFRQAMLSMNAPTKAFEELINGRKFRHYGNPVAAWMASNAVLETDRNGNCKPTKDPKRMTGRIDGIIAAIMGLGRWLTSGDVNGESVYENRGLLTI